MYWVIIRAAHVQAALISASMGKNSYILTDIIAAMCMAATGQIQLHTDWYQFAACT